MIRCRCPFLNVFSAVTTFIFNLVDLEQLTVPTEEHVFNFPSWCD